MAMADYYYCSRSSTTLRDGELNLVGFPFDGTACFRKGAAKGPKGIRQASSSLESYSPYLQRDLAHLAFYDLGNLPGDEWQSLNDNFSAHGPKECLRGRGKILALGGEHSISYAPIKSYLEHFPQLLVIHLDAHADLRDGYQGFHYSHASIIRRILDLFGHNHSLLQYGIRSGTADEYHTMKEKNYLKEDLTDFLNTISAISSTRPIYLTLDLDYFDPAYLPGTGTPEPGGETFNSFVKLVKVLQNKNLVGADVVELAPNIDPTGNSSVFAAKVVRELIVLMANDVGEENGK